MMMMMIGGGSVNGCWDGKGWFLIGWDGKGVIRGGGGKEVGGELQFTAVRGRAKACAW